MFQKSFILVFALVFSLFINVSAQHNDCDNMLVLKDTIYHTKGIIGFGDKKEFDGNELESLKYFESEKNSIWYLITSPSTGAFTFDIITQNKNDDWDFLLYEHKKMFCKRIDAKKIEPIRSNLSRSPITGLSRKAKESFVGAGLNINYSRPIHVDKGEQFVLVVNNPKRAGGKHTLILHFPTVKGKVPAIVVKEKTEPKVITTLFHLSIKDAITKKLVSSDVNITGLKKEAIELDSITNYETTIIKKNHTVYINASAKGYMLTSQSFKIGKTKVAFDTDVFLEKIEAGKRVNLKNIQFYGNRADFLPLAKSPLRALLSFLTTNEKVVIEIEGHVNGPGSKNTKDYQDLSYSRAYAVKSFLMKNGINEERIDFKGYGNSKMLYPNPKSEYQQSANRRVEIKIISNEFNSGVRNIH